MRSTQLNSWQQLQPTLSTRQCQVLEAIVKLGGKATNRQIAKCLSWEINRVTGRVNELNEKRILDSNTTVKDVETNRTVTLWHITNEDERELILTF